MRLVWRQRLRVFCALGLSIGFGGCRDSTGAPADAAPLLNSTVGTEWRYRVRDSVVMGSPLPGPPITFTWSVRHRADTVAFGARWMVLEGGESLFYKGGGTIMVRNGRDGLEALVILPSPLPTTTVLLLPRRSGAVTRYWRLDAAVDTVNTPIGAFSALRFTSPMQAPLVAGTPPWREYVWLDPAVGVVRTMSPPIIEQDPTGAVVRRWVQLRELIAVTRP